MEDDERCQALEPLAEAMELEPSELLELLGELLGEAAANDDCFAGDDVSASAA